MMSNLDRRFLTVTFVGTIIFVAVYLLSLFIPWEVLVDNQVLAWVQSLFALLGFLGPAILGVTALNHWSFGKPFRQRWGTIIACFLVSWVWFYLATVGIELVNAAEGQQWGDALNNLTNPDIVMMTMIITPIVFWVSGWVLKTTHRVHHKNRNSNNSI